jgi:diacylglycerol kinase (ATP)
MINYAPHWMAEALMKYFIIVNPISGHGLGERSISAIEGGMRAFGLAYDLVRTERPWHAVELAEQAAKGNYDVVVSASGDGTLNETLNGLMRARSAGHKPTALGVLPIAMTSPAASESRRTWKTG